MSFWTKRRKIQSKIEKHLQNIEENEKCDMAGMLSHSTGGVGDKADHAMATVDEVEHVIPGAFSNVDSTSSATADPVGFDIPSSDSSEDEEECGDRQNIRELLKKWAIEHQITHTALGDLLDKLRLFHPELPKDPRTLLTVPKVAGIKELGGGSYYHFGIGNGIRAAFAMDPVLKDNSTVKLQINVDGLPLFKSSSAQFWPILGRLPEASELQPFPIGIFYGNTKPTDPKEFLHDFVAEAAGLQANGLIYNDKTYKFCISNFVCDTPARAYIKGTKSHTGYSGCDRCTQHGVYDRKMTFPETNARLRTDVSFDEMMDEDHHVRPCPLRGASFGMVSQFPLDYMHLVCLGVMRRILLLWMKGPLLTRLGGQLKTEISQIVMSMSRYIPKEFARKPRALTEIDRWKATEFRLFLLYTGPVALKDVNMPKELYDNFMLLSVAIHILVNPQFCNALSDYAHRLILCFVEHFSQLYGPDQITYNVHCLVHLVEDVKIHGCLDLFSAFPFENYLKQLKRLLRKPNFVLQQVVMRLMEKSMIYDSITVAKEEVRSVKYLKEHTRGPLPAGEFCSGCLQYGEAHLRDFCISTAAPNYCVKIGVHICLIQNIVKCSSGLYVVYKKFLSKKPLFSYPLDSSKIDIHEVACISGQLLVANINEIKGKYALLPVKDFQAALPVIHTF